MNEDLDLEGLRGNIRHWNKTGIAGYVALGSTGERVNLSEREALGVVEAARAEVTSELTFIVGVGQQSTRQTINEVKNVAAAGADAVLVITPNFYRPAITASTLIKHYRTVADASPVPVILYSMPDLTGVVIEPDVVRQLSEHPNIIGIKDSSNDIPRFKHVLASVPAEFHVMSGNGTVFSEALAGGGRGAILAVGCAAAEQCVRIYRHLEDDKKAQAFSLQQKLTPLALAVTKRYGIGGLKIALEIAGLVGGNVRAPLQVPNEAARLEIEQLLNAVLTDPNDETSTSVLASLEH
jgi:4-hydroxy-2-oxoglutarate aldolase